MIVDNRDGFRVFLCEGPPNLQPLSGDLPMTFGVRLNTYVVFRVLNKDRWILVILVIYFYFSNIHWGLGMRKFRLNVWGVRVCQNSVQVLFEGLRFLGLSGFRLRAWENWSQAAETYTCTLWRVSGFGQTEGWWKRFVLICADQETSSETSQETYQKTSKGFITRHHKVLWFYTAASLPPVILPMVFKSLIYERVQVMFVVTNGYEWHEWGKHISHICAVLLPPQTPQNALSQFRKPACDRIGPPFWCLHKKP